MEKRQNESETEFEKASERGETDREAMRGRPGSHLQVNVEKRQFLERKKRASKSISGQITIKRNDKSKKIPRMRN